MKPKRVRRSAADARAEILEAAEAALQDRDLNDLTVDLLMERTGMTRSSFYHYFRSLDEIAVALFDRVEAEVSGAVDAWLEGESGDDPRSTTVHHLTRMYEVWQKHASLMRAMEQAAGRDRLAYEGWRERVVDGYIAKTAAFIRRQRRPAAGAPAPDPERLASALILMNLAVASDQVRRATPQPPEQLGATVGHVWNAAIFGNH